MRKCNACQQTYPDDIEYCPRDGTRVVTLVTEADALIAAGLARRFHIVRRLGQGGMGTVFLAEQLGVGNRQVALKVLNRSLLDDPQFQMRFRAEAASTGRIRHANVVTVHESGQADDGTPYIAMEYLEGETLRDALKTSGAFNVTDCAEILTQLARGLNSAHRLGIIHRDLKPDNVFLTHGDEGELIVKIVDFGIAKLREAVTQTMAGTVLGTPAYMSSEQASGMPSDQLDARADVYSLGIVAYEMLSGRVPFQSSTPLGYLRKHMLDEPPPFHTVAPGLPVSRQLEATVMKALQKEREQRYTTALEFARAFAAAAPGGSLEATAEALPSTKIVSPPAAGEFDSATPQFAGARPAANVAVQTPPPTAAAGMRSASSAAARLAGPEPGRPSAGEEYATPHFRIVTESSNVAMYVIVGVVLLAVVAVGAWYFSRAASPAAKAVHGADGSAPSASSRVVAIPGGTFTMGRDNTGDPEEAPAHTVSVAAFSMDKRPVTNVQYADFVRSAGAAAPAAWTNGAFPDSQAAWPVTGVSWNDANAYCSSKGLRLPSEAEWEYAARGNDRRLYPWGDDFSPALTNSAEAELGRPEAVGAHRDAASPFGVQDMSGNVWQWTADGYQPYPGGHARFATPADAKVIRGGSYQSDKLHVTTTTRNLDHASTRSPIIGFRCAQ